MLRLALVLSLGLIVSACSAPVPQSTTGTPLSLKVGVAVTPAPALPESVIWLARDLGFYQAEGLDVQLTEYDATPTVVTAMRTGDVDVGDINSEDVIRLTASKDLEMRTIDSASGRNFFMIVSKSSVGSVLELQGKSFAVA